MKVSVDPQDKGVMLFIPETEFERSWLQRDVVGMKLEGKFMSDKAFVLDVTQDNET